MSEKKVVKPVALAVGVALASAFALGGVANAEGVDNPFEMSTLTAGYMLGEGEGSCGGDVKEKAEGSCGGDAKEKAEGSCGGDTNEDGDAEAEPKEGEGSCGGTEGESEEKDGEGSCGEGSCGGLV
jgi:uncharacterized low-complexity protein